MVGVIVRIVRQHRRRARPGQAVILAVGADRLRRAGAAHVAVDAQDAVGPRHHDVEVVRHHQDAEVALAADTVDQVVDRDLADEVDALRRLVEDEDVRLDGDRAGEHHPLQLAAGQRRHHAAGEVGAVDRRERRGERGLAQSGGEAHEALDRDRQRPVDLEPLRHVADPQPAGARHRPRGGRYEPEQRLDDGRLAAAVGADEGDHLAACDGDVDAANDLAAAEANPEPSCVQEHPAIVNGHFS
jgi:hypothetical protein